MNSCQCTYYYKSLPNDWFAQFVAYWCLLISIVLADDLLDLDNFWIEKWK